MRIRVYYEDTDVGGIVYHANYIKYCERARSEVFFAKGIKPLSDGGAGFVVRRLEAEFIGVAKLGDILEVKSRVLNIKRSIVLLKQSIYNESNCIFDAMITLVYIKNGKPFSIPNNIKDIIEGMDTF